MRGEVVGGKGSIGIFIAGALLKGEAEGWRGRADMRGGEREGFARRGSLCERVGVFLGGRERC